MTLVEGLVAIALLLVVTGLIAACLCSSVTLLHDGRQRIRAQEMGKLFIAQLENELRGSTRVEVAESGRIIAFKCMTGEALAYTFDPDEFSLTRHIRGPSGSARIERVFSDEFCVKSCSFRMRKGFVAVCLSLADRDKQDSARGDNLQAFQGRAALRVSE